jgi:hypothetical protein
LIYAELAYGNKASILDILLYLNPVGNSDKKFWQLVFSIEIMTEIMFTMQYMESADMLNVRFHFRGKFVRIGPQLDYVGGDEGMSIIERNKLSFREIKGHLTDHTDIKKSMKSYFLVPGRAMSEGLVFLCDDNGCIKISDHITHGGVADLNGRTK